MKLRNLLNDGVADVGDSDAEGLIASGYWVVDGDAPTRKARSPRTKKAPAQEPESEE